MSAGSPSRSSASIRKTSLSKLPPSCQAWTFCHASEFDRCPRLDVVAADATGAVAEAGHDERQSEAALVAGDVRVHPCGVGVECRPRASESRVEVLLGGLPPAERPDEAVLVERGLAEQLGQPPGRDVAPHLHLPEPLLGMDVALGEEQVGGLSA